MSVFRMAWYWAVDYLYMLCGGILMLIYTRPPDHYLDYKVPGKAPVVLLPGILGKWSFMKPLADRVSLSGHPVYVVSRLRYNVFSIATSARKVSAFFLHAVPGLGHIIPDVPSGSRNVK